MKEQDIRFLKSVAADYYTQQADLVYVPPPVNKREIGFTVGHDKIMARHKSFDTIDDIRKYLLDDLPWDAYHSCAIYEFPDKPIDEKKDLWVELAFDIDPDAIGAKCGESSMYWVCNAGEHYGKGAPEKCDHCGGSIREIEFIDPVCLSATGKEGTKLVRVLTNELGIVNDDIKIYFSGNKGFHLYVSSDFLKELDQNGRKEIVDYLALNGFKEEYIIKKSFEKRFISDEGVGKRIIQSAMEIVEQYQSYPRVFSGAVGNRVGKKREQLKADLSKGSLDSTFSILGATKAKRFLALAVQNSAVKVDPSVTLDLHRLFRMPGTLSSKSHLPKIPVELKTLEGNVLDNMPKYGENVVEIEVKIAPQISINRTRFGPFENERTVVPAYLAAYLMTKGVATIV